MRDMLNDLYRECSYLPLSSPEQSLALAIAASALGSAGTPAAQLREASFTLRVAFGK
jgi:hypothetical protein